MRPWELAGYDPGEWYELIRTDPEAMQCWHCGLGAWERPDDWSAPWLIERAHIVSAPRVEDRRVIIMLCSLCHRIQHGENLGAMAGDRRQLTLPHMLWIKRQADRGWWDPGFLERHHVGKLPAPERPNR